MKIAGISRGHNASVCLINDGEVEFYIEEERLTRSKYDGAPFKGLLFLKEYAGEVDYIAVSHTYTFEPPMDWTQEDLYMGFARKIGLIKNEKQYFKMGDKHHELHAALAFYNSGFDTAAALIVDGAGTFIQLGEGITGYEFESIFKVSYPDDFLPIYKHIGVKGWDRENLKQKGPKGEELFFTKHPGIAKTYEAATNYCDFHVLEAGKTMGLSALGKQNKKIPKLFDDDNLSNKEFFIPDFPNGALLNKEKFKWLETSNKEELQKNRQDIAYAVQKETEREMCFLINKALDLTKENNIVISGGYALNCVANYRYLDHLKNKINLYIEPVSHDGGTSLGAAKRLWYQLTKNTKKKPIKNLYLGPQYKTEKYEILLKGRKVERADEKKIVEIIEEKNIVAIFQGSSEAGPRALGNRSFLFDPRVINGKDIVNKVKKREWFRPFAGTILEEDVHDWFDLRKMDQSPYMMYAVNCKPNIKEKIPAVIHFDNTCRIQTVNKEQNENFYNLIKAFKNKTKVPILFNTSLNLAGEPLVETLKDALNLLDNSEVKYLYLPEIKKLVIK